MIHIAYAIVNGRIYVRLQHVLIASSRHCVSKSTMSFFVVYTRHKEFAVFEIKKISLEFDCCMISQQILHEQL